MMKQCGLIKLSPPAANSGQDTPLMRVQTVFNTSTAHNMNIATVILYEDRLYYADINGVVDLIETAITEEKSDNLQAYYDFLGDCDVLKDSITTEYRLANLKELQLVHTLLGVTPRTLALPDDVLGCISAYLTPTDKMRLTLSGAIYAESSRFFISRQQTIVNKLIELTLQGNESKVERMLKLHPEYVTEKGTATDYSGRNFQNVSAFECALWALDTRYMCNMMLDCLPYSPQGEAIKQELLAQFNSHQQGGVVYELNDETIHEKHYDFTPLFEALRTFLTGYDEWNTNSDWDAISDQWSGVVGLAQRYVPAHVAQHYCTPDVSYIPISDKQVRESFPSFKEKIFTRSLLVHHLNRSKTLFWYPPPSSTSGLGFNYGIYRSSGLAFYTGMPIITASIIERDLAAMTALRDVRTQDLDSLMQRLERPLEKPDVDPETPQP